MSLNFNSMPPFKQSRSLKQLNCQGQLSPLRNNDQSKLVRKSTSSYYQQQRQPKQLQNDSQSTRDSFSSQNTNDSSDHFFQFLTQEVCNKEKQHNYQSFHKRTSLQNHQKLTQNDFDKIQDLSGKLKDKCQSQSQFIKYDNCERIYFMSLFIMLFLITTSVIITFKDELNFM